MEVSTSFDPEEKVVIVSIKTPLLKNHYKVFKDLIDGAKKSKCLPEGLKLEQLDPENKEEACVLFPILGGDSGVNFSTSGKVVSVKKDFMQTLSDNINVFVRQALYKEQCRLEFIPLNGYPAESLKEDIQNAVKAKRSLCIIGEYEEFLRSKANNKDSYSFHQYIVEYGTDEYDEVAISLFNCELDELKKEYQNKLVFTNWL